MKELKDMLNQIGIDKGEEKAEKLQRYMEMILQRNHHVNLTAITEPKEFIEKHYADSLACAGLKEFQEAQTVLDLGTGGGFPGVPLAICYPQKSFTLVDSLNKRIRIIREFCAELGVENVKAIHGRAEDLGRQEDLRDQFDLCVSRAVADLHVLAEYCLPFVRAGGWFIAYKGADCEEEVAGAARAIRMLGGEVDRMEDAFARGRWQESVAAEKHRPGSAAVEKHRLVMIRKVKDTPAAYPRKPGTPAKKPL